MRLYIRLEDGQGPLDVGDKATLAPGQATTIDLDGDITLRASAPRTAVGKIEDPIDVFSPTNRPNGTMQASIAPKMPKSGGETMQEVVRPGVLVERPVAELGRATQGGGPDSEDGVATPGGFTALPPAPQGGEDPAAVGAGPTTGEPPKPPPPPKVQAKEPARK